ncbi:MAG: acyl--CoA ligase [Bdellovibrionaceae bacterium]|nr:acyl--CoA ligase [Bdellovibrio sp.]
MAEKYKVYQGYHHEELYELLKKYWAEGTPLIIQPPHLKNIQLLENVELPPSTAVGIYTSGTLTGQPRLVLYSKKNIETSLAAIRGLFNLKKIDQIFCYPQPTHTFGLTLGYLQSILFNLPIRFHPGPYSTKAHEMWYEQLTPGTLTLGTPTHFIDLIHFVKKNSLNMKKSYSAIIGGAPVTQRLWHELQSKLGIAAPSIGYGSTEASPGLTHLAPGVVPQCDSDIGEILANVKIFDKNEDGFYFSGPNLCLAIVDERGLVVPEKVQIKDNLILCAQGHFVFNGRSDLTINRGGLKLSPEMIESRLQSELDLKVVCVAFYNERLGEDIGLVAEPRADQSAIQNLLKNEFSIQLPPENILLRSIPYNANLKIDRIECIKYFLHEKKMACPFSVEYLKPFLPHRSSAIWIHRLISFDAKKGRAEVDLKLNSMIFSDGKLRESACIELIGQTYGYAKAAYEISILDVNQPAVKANKTLIAEIRNADFQFNLSVDEIIFAAKAEGVPLVIEAECTHEFGPIKVIRGVVQVKNKVIAELSMKAFVSP